MTIYTKNQEAIAKKIQPETKLSNWMDWKWHVRHAIKTISRI